MANFTEDQAEASKLESTKKEFTDGNFAYWILRVSGSDGQYRQFIDKDLPENATLAKVKSKLVGHMTGSDFYIAKVPPVISGSVSYASAIGNTLG